MNLGGLYAMPRKESNENGRKTVPVDRYHGVPQFRETQEYVDRVLALMCDHPDRILLTLSSCR
jgi:hypothetical protein